MAIPYKQTEPARRKSELMTAGQPITDMWLKMAFGFESMRTATVP